MKCLPECGYQEMPNNTVILRRHMETCFLDGALKDVENPDVVWRDGEFVVVHQAEEDEQKYNEDIAWKRPKLDEEVVAVLEEEPVEE